MYFENIQKKSKREGYFGGLKKTDFSIFEL
jgi:hypothetical protein